VAESSMPRLREVVKVKQTNKNKKIRLGFTHIRKIEMDVNLIALHMLDKTIDNVEVVGTDSEMIITLSDGSTVELIIDSIYMNIQDLDD
tara:strand:+ start:59 stop:325 length:267 start_codon:yes stop_codon:yes gene_type:complete